MLNMKEQTRLAHLKDRGMVMAVTKAKEQGKKLLFVLLLVILQHQQLLMLQELV